MAKKKKSGLLGFLLKTLFRVLLIGLVVGGYYFYRNPSMLAEITEQYPIVETVTGPISSLSASKTSNPSILGKTTSMVEEGLQNLKVPKQLTGNQEEIILQDIVDDFMKKLKNLPNDQANRIKVQFCEDLLQNVENVSIEKKQ